MPAKNTLTLQRAQRAAGHGKLPDNANGLAAYIRGLDYFHPERVAYHKATKPGSPAGSAPRTINELQRLAAGKPSLRKR